MEPPATRGSAVSAWIFLGVCVVLDGILLWPEGLSGWRFVAVVVGALAGAIAATRRGRLRALLWSVSWSVIGGMNAITIFHWPFGVRRGLGLALLVALFIFDIVQRSPRQTGGAQRGASEVRGSLAV